MVFKPGDKVKRIKGEHHHMKEGDVDVVKSIHQNMVDMTLVKFGIGHAMYNFELISHQTMRDLIE